MDVDNNKIVVLCVFKRLKNYVMIKIRMIWYCIIL